MCIGGNSPSQEQRKTGVVKRFLYLILILSACSCVLAQEEERQALFWEQYLTELYENDEEAAWNMEEAHEHLMELSQQPLDINKVEVDELISIPGLPVDQASDIIRYREKYGRFRTMDELNMIASIDDRQQRYITSFMRVYDDAAKWYRGEQLKRNIRNISHTFLATAAIPTYYRAGDKGATSGGSEGVNKYANTYLGDPTKHSLRYSLTMGQNVKLNLAGAKTAGEPFFGNGNGMGYDTYAFNISLKRIGIFRHIIVGQFKAQFGMGLVLNNSFTLGKQGMMSSVGRLTNTFSPHSSTSDSKHLQGIAATVDLGRMQLSSFYSYRYIDATLNDDGSTISTILTSGDHRTVKEMEKKNNATQMTEGVHLRYGDVTKKGLDWMVGASFLHTSLNRNLDPTYSKADTISDGKMYRMFYPRGSRFWNVAVDYRIRWRDIIFAGETASSGTGSLATINSILWRTSSSVTLTALQRYYQHDYTALYASAFSDGGMVQNESGIYAGIKWVAMKRLVIDAYTDFAYFPWLRYRVSNTSYSWDNSITATYTLPRWTFAARYRLKTRQRDLTMTDDEGTKLKQLAEKTDQRLRLTASYTGNRWSSKTQVEGCMLRFDDVSNGVMVSQTLSYDINKVFSVYASGAYFNTDDYDSRLYTYEKGMLYSFAYSAFYGRGLRASMLLKANVSRAFTAQVKVGHTHYYDRDVIGTAERQIFSNHQTDIDLQVKVKL